MQTEVDGRTRLVGHIGPLIQAHGGVSLAQHERREAARLQLLPQALRESQRDVLLRQLVAKGSAAFVAPVAGVHDYKILHRARNRRRRRRSGWDLRSWTAPGTGAGDGAAGV